MVTIGEGRQNDIGACPKQGPYLNGFVLAAGYEPVLRLMYIQAPARYEQSTSGNTKFAMQCNGILTPRRKTFPRKSFARKTFP